MEPNAAEAKILLSFIERIERLEEDARQVGEDVKDVFAEAKGNGYDIKIMRKVIALRKKSPHQRQQEEEIMNLYLNALGMLSDTPLGQAAVASFKSTLGRPAPLTDLEKEMGVSAAFVDKKGTRSTIAMA